MIATTLRTVSADLAETIRTLTPDYPLYQDARWTPVERVIDVPGEQMRLFHCEWDDAVPLDDGIYGDAIEYGTNLRVWTNYRHLSEEDGETQDRAAEIVTADARQLYVVLQERLDPVVDGLTWVAPLGWTPEVAEPGHLWGFHEFEVRLLLAAY